MIRRVSAAVTVGWIRILAMFWMDMETAADRITKLHATISGAKSRGRE
jgi:hypothetical protein